MAAKPGTAIAFSSASTRHFSTFEGFTTMTGGSDVEIAESWTIDAALLKQIQAVDDGWITDGKVTFADGAKILITGTPSRHTFSDPSELILLNAAKGIEGNYQVQMSDAVAEFWEFSESSDHKQLKLKYLPPGMIMIVR